MTASALRNRGVSNDQRVGQVYYAHQQDILEDVGVDSDSAIELVFSEGDDGGEDMGREDGGRH